MCISVVVSQECLKGSACGLCLCMFCYSALLQYFRSSHNIHYKRSPLYFPQSYTPVLARIFTAVGPLTIAAPFTSKQLFETVCSSQFARIFTHMVSGQLLSAPHFKNVSQLRWSSCWSFKIGVDLLSTVPRLTSLIGISQAAQFEMPSSKRFTGNGFCELKVVFSVNQCNVYFLSMH